MKLLYGIMALAMLYISGVAYAGLHLLPGTKPVYGIEDVNQNSVQCKIKDVVLLAKTASDCNAAGGEMIK